jgi:hypothetical protein
MQSVAAEEGIVLLHFQPTLLQFFVSGGEIAGRGLALGNRFCAFNNNVIAHKISFWN